MILMMTLIVLNWSFIQWGQTCMSRVVRAERPFVRTLEKKKILNRKPQSATNTPMDIKPSESVHGFSQMAIPLCTFPIRNHAVVKSTSSK